MSEHHTVYADIPHEVRDLLDQVYLHRGVETWWNSRHGWLANMCARDEWKTAPGRDRVRRVVDALTGGAW